MAISAFGEPTERHCLEGIGGVHPLRPGRDAIPGPLTLFALRQRHGIGPDRKSDVEVRNKHEWRSLPIPNGHRRIATAFRSLEFSALDLFRISHFVLRISLCYWPNAVNLPHTPATGVYAGSTFRPSPEIREESKNYGQVLYTERSSRYDLS